MAEIRFEYKPLPVHVDFHQATSYERCLFGAFGSGKTYAIVAEAIAWCLEQPGIRGVMCRYTIPELRDSLEPIFFEMLPNELYAAGEVKKSGGHVERFIFPNGSEVLFRSLQDWERHRSLNVGFIAYDEANLIDEETYQGMKSRVRQRDITSLARQLGYTHEITRRGIWLATNPSGHDWVWERFVNKVNAENQRIDTAYFRSTSLDNPYLPPEYVESLLAYPEPWVRRYVLCGFDDFGGSIYPDWQWDTHVVDPLKGKYDKTNVFWMGMDPGTRNPTAGLWVYVDRPKRLLVGVAEYQESYSAAVQHAANWRKIEAEHNMTVRRRIADPNINTHDRGSNNTLSDQYRRLGYTFQLGPRQHKDRIPMLGSLIALGRFKVTKDCPNTYEAIKGYRWEDLTPHQRAKGTDPKEAPKKHNDHLVDCAQYVASQWVSPTKYQPPAEFLTPQQELSQDIHAAIRKQTSRKRQRRSTSHQLGGIRV